MIEKQQANVLSSRKEKEACSSFSGAVSEMDKCCNKPFHGESRCLIVIINWKYDTNTAFV